MDAKKFASVFNTVIDSCDKTLIGKAEEYATSDRLHNFKIAASLKLETPTQALGGMMVKHTVSIYDMIRDEDNVHSLEKWDEKITDHINYLILLRALVVEAAEEFQAEHPSMDSPGPRRPTIVNTPTSTTLPSPIKIPDAQKDNNA